MPVPGAVQTAKTPVNSATRTNASLFQSQGQERAGAVRSDAATVLARACLFSRRGGPLSARGRARRGRPAGAAARSNAASLSAAAGCQPVWVTFGLWPG